MQGAHKAYLYHLVLIEPFILQVVGVEVSIIGHFHAVADISPEPSHGRHDIVHIISHDYAILVQVAVPHFDWPGCIGGIPD